ncbi:MAG: hypothetical protein Q4F33_03295 [Mycoplasmatota bacterium]|nr:hypothetical protein [Mycoplasmatota bacterium]
MKFILVNDLMHLLNNRKKYLLLYIIIPFLVSLLLPLELPDKLSSLFFSLGNNLNINKCNIVEICMYLFNVLMFIFLVADLFFKDLAYYKEYIFLRKKIHIWFSYKTIFVLLLSFCIKLFEYLIITIYLDFFSDISYVYVTKIMLLDINYLILIFFILVIVYILCKLFSNISIVLLVLICGVVPKNIIQTGSYYLVVVFLNIIVYISIMIMLKSNGKKIVQDGGI